MGKIIRVIVAAKKSMPKESVEAIIEGESGIRIELPDPAPESDERVSVWSLVFGKKNVK